jgi:hypothetical protein
MVILVKADIAVTSQDAYIAIMCQSFSIPVSILWQLPSVLKWRKL